MREGNGGEEGEMSCMEVGMEVGTFLSRVYESGLLV